MVEILRRDRWLRTVAATIVCVVAAAGLTSAPSDASVRHAGTGKAYSAPSLVAPGVSSRTPTSDPTALPKTPHCVDVVFLGARGSGQTAEARHYGMGPQVASSFESYLQRLSGRVVAYDDVTYPSQDVIVLLSHKRQFFKGIDQGVDYALDTLKARAKKCSQERYVLAGYSQGAMVIHRVVDRLPDSLLRRLDGVILLADGDRIANEGGQRYGSSPRRDSGVSSLFPALAGDRHEPRLRQPPASVRQRFHSFCLDKDIVCDSTYALTPGMLDRILPSKKVHESPLYRNSRDVEAMARAVAKQTMSRASSALYGPSSATLPAAVVGQPYSSAIPGIHGAQRPYTFSITSGFPAPGVGLDSQTGVLSGTPLASGTFTMTVRVTASNGAGLHATITHHVGPAAATPGPTASPSPTPTPTPLPPSPSPSPTQPFSPRPGLQLITNGNNASFVPSISRDGRVIVFDTDATDLGEHCADDHAFATWVADIGTACHSAPAGYGGVGSVSRVSDDGRYVAFTSWLADASPPRTDLFVKDRATGTTTQVTRGNASSDWPSISGAGEYVAFVSVASDLVAGDTNEEADVFLWSRASGQISRVTDGNDGSSDASISADGRFIAYSSSASDVVPGDIYRDVFLWDRATGATTQITDGTGESSAPTISSDGSTVAFWSSSSELVEGDTNSIPDVFVWSRATGVVERVPHGSRYTHAQFLDVSGDGQLVAFAAPVDPSLPGANEEVGFVWHRGRATLTQVTDGHAHAPALSADGRYLTFASYQRLLPSDTNQFADLYLQELGDLAQQQGSPPGS